MTVSPARFVTPVLALFLVLDVLYSGCALYRYNQRQLRIQPATPVGRYFDDQFDDELMQRVYPYAKTGRGKMKENLQQSENFQQSEEKAPGS